MYFKVIPVGKRSCLIETYTIIDNFLYCLCFFLQCFQSTGNEE